MYLRIRITRVVLGSRSPGGGGGEGDGRCFFLGVRVWERRSE